MSNNKFSRYAQITLLNHTWLAAVFQAFLVCASLILAWVLRFDFSLPHRRTLLTVLPILVAARLAAIWRFGLLRGWWRYVGPEDMVQIVKAVALGSLAFLVLVRYVFDITRFPRSVYILEALLTAGMLAGARVLSRLLAESMRQELSGARKVVVIGAGTAAQMVCRELQQPGSGYRVMACFDDDRTKAGLKIIGAPVIGSVDQMPERLAGMNAGEIIIAIPSATSAQMSRFVEIAERTGLRYRTMPSLRELIVGDLLLRQIREVNLDDLLGRESVALDLLAVRDELAGKVVMVTGAAGSIGSELCRQILEFAPSALVCLDQNETGLFHLEAELKVLPGYSRLVFRVGDVGDRERMVRVCSSNQVKIIFHAAAYKHVPMMEANVQEAVQNNVMGLLTLLDVAEETHCRDLVLISSDKAVNPTSVMGATKRICELVLSSRPPNGLRCASVRFGNVLGSNGSVIPTFQEQLRRNQPLTVTHPEIQRFFMTIREAVSLVLQAFAIGSHGDVLVLDMGQPVKIADLARKLIHLAGKSEDEVQILFTGLRPGEKLSEDLFYPTEELLPTAHPKIRQTRLVGPGWPALMLQLSELRRVSFTGDAGEIRAKIKEIVPEYECPADAEKVKSSAIHVYSGTRQRAVGER
jgi:FlaA1/EpsC-like NDP-sugar epimerase